MEFKDFLSSKNIAADAFKASEVSLYITWENAFKLIHPNSLTEQYKFQINKIRRKYPEKLEF